MTFLDVMDLWSGPQLLADDLGMKLTRVQKWRARKKIPPRAWPALLRAARKRGFQIDADTLVGISAKRIPRAPDLAARV